MVATLSHLRHANLFASKLLERGRQDPSLTTLVKAAHGLKVSLSRVVESL
jgi:hypothetical protein